MGKEKDECIKLRLRQQASLCLHNRLRLFFSTAQREAMRTDSSNVAVIYTHRYHLLKANIKQLGPSKQL